MHRYNTDRVRTLHDGGYIQQAEQVGPLTGLTDARVGSLARKEPRRRSQLASSVRLSAVRLGRAQERARDESCAILDT